MCFVFWVVLLMFGLSGSGFEENGLGCKAIGFRVQISGLGSGVWGMDFGF